METVLFDEDVPQGPESPAYFPITSRPPTPPGHFGDLAQPASPNSHVLAINQDLESVIIQTTVRVTEPRVLDYFDMPGGGKEPISQYTYYQYPNVMRDFSGLPPIHHYTLRFWINFVDPSDADVEPDACPDFNDAATRRSHDTNIIQQLIRRKVFSELYAEGIVIYYGVSSPLIHTTEGVQFEARPRSDTKPRQFMDIKLPAWSISVVNELMRPNAMRTDSTAFKLLEHPDVGIGPIAPPQYAIAQCTVPDRNNMERINADRNSYNHHVNLFKESFENWKSIHRTRHSIVASGGFFDKDDFWDYQIFVIFKVPLPAGSEEINDASKLRHEFEKFPAYTMFGTQMVRNKLNFRKGCPECQYKATYIHDAKGHRCSTCFEVGHLTRICPVTKSIVQQKKRTIDFNFKSVSMEGPVAQMPYDPVVEEYERKQLAKRRRI